jgi:phospholipase/carboxylesterase
VPLGLGSQRDGLLYIPAAYSAANPAPFILTLHGAGGDSQGASVYEPRPSPRSCTEWQVALHFSFLMPLPVCPPTHACMQAGGLSHLIKHADACGTILLAPESRGSTWDMLRGGFGPGGAPSWPALLPCRSVACRLSQPGYCAFLQVT